MCPITEKYIKNIYEDSNSIPVRVDGALERQLINKGKRVLTLARQGKNLIFPDILKIEAELLKQTQFEELKRPH